MLRERTRSHLKDQQMGHLTLTMSSDSGSDSFTHSDSLGFNHKTNSFFTAPGLFVGLSPKGISDCDSVRSPTSPLDFRLFSNLGNSYRSQRSTLYGNHKSWDSSKVGLSILNSLDADVKESGKVLQSSESKNILLGQKVRIKAPNFQANANSFEAPQSLPRNFAIFTHTRIKSPLEKGSSDVIFEIGEAPFEPDCFGKIRSCSLDSCKSFSTLARLGERNSKLSPGSFPLNNITSCRSNSPLQFPAELDLNTTPMSTGSASGLVGGLSASEIELSEDYTCVISHGPNPKKTHIYGDCVLGCSSCEEKETGIPQANASSKTATPFPSDDFLKFCYYCNKKLDGSKDIYIYRGEKAFCSLSCRSEEIMNDEEMEKTINKPSDGYHKSVEDGYHKSVEDGEELSENSIFFAP